MFHSPRCHAIAHPWGELEGGYHGLGCLALTPIILGASRVPASPSRNNALACRGVQGLGSYRGLPWGPCRVLAIDAEVGVVNFLTTFVGFSPQGGRSKRKRACIEGLRVIHVELHASR